MADGLFGVVPNFSEGRRADVIDAICRALQTPGARLVSRQADPDHNRLDTTLLGDRDAVGRAAMSGARVAVGLIDMEHHEGGHPRMGAVDVVPFIPVRDVTIEDCVELARSFAQDLAATLDLPVYLYDRAALRPERASLADVRAGEFEGLRDAVSRGDRLPDFGPHVIGAAGATAVGAAVSQPFQSGRYYHLPIAGSAPSTSAGLGNGTLRAAPFYVGSTTSFVRSRSVFRNAGASPCR